MGPDDTQADFVPGKFAMEPVQHLRAREVHIGRSGKITDNQSYRARISLPQTGHDRFHNGIGIDVDQRCFGTKSDHARQRLVLGVTFQV